MSEVAHSTHASQNLNANICWLVHACAACFVVQHLNLIKLNAKAQASDHTDHLDEKERDCT